jgi:hypothetical protein
MQILRSFILLTFFVGLFNCAIFKKENRRITNALDDAVDPHTTTNKVLLAPVMIPVGSISLLTDAFILQPLVSIPLGLGKTYEIVWENPSGGIMVQTFLLIPKLIFTPITFTLAWVYYSIFDY